MSYAIALKRKSIHIGIFFAEREKEWEREKTDYDYILV